MRKNMKKSAKTKTECVRRLQAVADALASEGEPPNRIITGLKDVIIATARKNCARIDVSQTLFEVSDLLVDEAELVIVESQR
jgi:hypothetical protein